MRFLRLISSIPLAFAVVFASPIPIPGQEAPAAPAAAEQKAEAPKIELPKFEQPVFITDIGQGNTARLVEVMLRRGKKVEFKTEALGTPKDLTESKAKTLLIGVGGSTKGLGAAGLDANVETERMNALIEAAKKAKIPVVGVHMGGMPRRGELSDLFIKQVFEKSDLFVLYKGGDEDGFFTRMEKAKEKPTDRPLLVVVDRKPEVGAKIEAHVAPKKEKDGEKEKAAKPDAKADKKPAAKKSE